MASSNVSTCSHSSQSKSSRFSTTLNVFKFASKVSKPQDPPMPPPKDKYHFSNRSLVSLSPDSLSVPTTPVLAEPQHPYMLSSDANNSAYSVISTSLSARSAAGGDSSSHQSVKKSKSGFFKFPKRSQRTPSVQSSLMEDVLPPPLPDENIGVPFNFQHNIHVDEGLMGLPPSWTMLLEQAGYNEEEIEEIHARRAASRAHYHSDRPATPAYSLTEASITNHGNRSTSLGRPDSRGSRDRVRTSSPRSTQSPSPSQVSSLRCPTIPARNSSLRYGTEQTSIIPHHQTEPRARSGSIGTLLSDNVNQTSDSSPPLTHVARPVTPPRRTFHVTNDSTNTPPPSYTNTPLNHKTTYLPEKEGPSVSVTEPRAHSSPDSTQPSNSPEVIASVTEPGEPEQDTERSFNERAPSEFSEESGDSCLTDTGSSEKRLTLVPPRLSLHKCTDSADLSSWGEAFLSEISVTGKFSLGSSTSAADGEHSKSICDLTTDSEVITAASSPKKNPAKKGKIPQTRFLPLSPLGLTRSGDKEDCVLSTGLDSPVQSTCSLPLQVEHVRVHVNEADEEAGLLASDCVREQRNGSRENRESSRSSISTITAEPVTIVESASILRRVDAYVIPNVRVRDDAARASVGMERVEAVLPSQVYGLATEDKKHPPSPLSLNFDSEEAASTSGSSSTLSQGRQSPLSELEADSPLTYYLDSSPSPDPSATLFPTSLKISVTDTLGIVKDPDIDIAPEVDGGTILSPHSKIVVNGSASPSLPAPLSEFSTTRSPLRPYPAWLSSAVTPLQRYIDETIDPRDFYLDLHEIAEGESGFVYAARLTKSNRHQLKLTHEVQSRDDDDITKNYTTKVAIKSVAIPPSGSQKLIDLERELSLMKGLWHLHVVTMDAVYVDLVDDALWIRMELMERSLADIIGLVPEGIMLSDSIISRFANDILSALEFLRDHCIAHRDVRSDNLLLNGKGVLKLTDFSNGVQVKRESPMQSDAAGVLYWQAPEVRSPPYDALKVDIWSMGATVWEMAEAEPPFASTKNIADSWPPLSKPELHSSDFHEFLSLCSKSPLSRPTPTELKKTSFIDSACQRSTISELLTRCLSMERSIRERDASQG